MLQDSGYYHTDYISKSRQGWRILERYPALLILGFRFLHGLRTVTPFASGNGLNSLIQLFEGVQASA